MANQFIRNRFKIINEADKELLAGIKGIEEQTLNDLLDYINSQFALSSGSFVGGNFAEINQIANQIRS